MDVFETKNLRLDTDGLVWMLVLDADGEEDSRLLGDVDSCSRRVPSHLDDEFLEICEAWEQYQRECQSYEAGVDLAYRMAKGW